jgi:hypothetical protein
MRPTFAALAPSTSADVLGQERNQSFEARRLPPSALAGMSALRIFAVAIGGVIREIHVQGQPEQQSSASWKDSREWVSHLSLGSSNCAGMMTKRIIGVST